YLNEDDINKQNFEHFVKIMRLAWKLGNKKDYAALKSLKNWAEEMATTSNGGRERQKNFLTYAQRMIRENFIFNLNEPALNYMTSFEKDFSLGFSPFINEQNVEELMNEFALAENHIERNVNPKMVFFDLLMNVVRLLKK
ncbi:MAG TPA: DNA polymerase III subunit delta, partial [Paludibacteraceae bacterium]|nr:DNA polymerase III subunit delta [Paludibacteraceae bacterium]